MDYTGLLAETVVGAVSVAVVLVLTKSATQMREGHENQVRELVSGHHDQVSRLGDQWAASTRDVTESLRGVADELRELRRVVSPNGG